jgi:hypothetical protein
MGVQVELTIEQQRWRDVYPKEFDDGALFGRSRKAEGERERGGYPRGFHAWPLERRNAWWAGFNLGRWARGRK